MWLLETAANRHGRFPPEALLPYESNEGVSDGISTLEGKKY